MYLLHTIMMFSAFAFITGTPLNAVAVLKSDAIQGVVRFEQNNSSAESPQVTVLVNMTGLSPGKHGFHIHQFGDLSNGCVSAGPHYNPNSFTHGSPNDINRHVGDLGNLIADSDGNAVYQITDRELALSGTKSIIGRAVVVHKFVDDLGLGTGDKAAESKKTGNAGPRLACGVIGIASN